MHNTTACKNLKTLWLNLEINSILFKNVKLVRFFKSFALIILGLLFVFQVWVKPYFPGWRVLWERLAFCTSVSLNTRRLTTLTRRSAFSGTILCWHLLFSFTLRTMQCAITKAWRRWWRYGGIEAYLSRSRSGKSLFMQVICAHILRNTWPP